MNLSRDLGILLVLMGIGFLIGYGVAEKIEANEEQAAISGAVSSVGGMLVGYVYLAIEKRFQAKRSPHLRPQTYSPQVVGEVCAKCSQRVIFVGEAFFCDECGKPFHRRCGKPPRCTECDQSVPTANQVILAEFGLN